MFDEAQLVQQLPALAGKCYVFAELASSNDTARELIHNGAESGTLIVAECQTSGRGRGGHQWLCPAGEGLLFSYILEPDAPRAHWPRMAIAAGVAIAEALQSYGLPAKVKWPNDILIHGKKCAGILVETCKDSLIIGIGINVTVSQFPSGLHATSLRLQGLEIARERLLADILQRLIIWGSRIETAFHTIVTTVNAHCAFHGEIIVIHHAGQQLQGRMMGVNHDGHLILECEGELRSIAQAELLRPLH